MTGSPRTRSSGRAAVATLTGTTVEYYDFFIYGTASAIIFAPQFFPEFSPAAGLLASFAVFGVGFVARPLGAMVMGHFGDKVGRKSMLILSMIMVGAGTILIGFLPNYAAIGVWAPITLVILRLIQGFGVGGEWSAATLVAAEHAPRRHEALWTMFPQMGIPLGLVLANLVFMVASTSDAFSDWLWRIPFLLSGVLVFVGIWVRVGLAETPVFEAIGDAKRKTPLLDVVREHPGAIAIAAGLPVVSIMVTYIHSTFGLSYMTDALGAPNYIALAAVLVGSFVQAVTMMPVVGYLCDRTGQPVKVFLCGCVMFAVFIAVYFPLLNTGIAPLYFLATSLLGIGLGATFGPVAILISRLFPVEVRFSGSAVGYQISTLVGGAPAPFVAAAIWAGTSSWLGIAAYMLASLVVSSVAGWFLVRRLRQSPSTDVETQVVAEVEGGISR